MKLYKYASVNEYTLNSILTSKFSFAKATEFNDPFELIANVSHSIFDPNKLLDRIEGDKVSELEKLKEIKKLDIQNQYFIYCFSRIYDSLLMWSHYADSHKGVCIEFDVPDEVFDSMSFYDVEYTNSPVSIDLRVTLTTDPNTNQSNGTDDLMDWHKLVIQKSKDWEYEQEVRCIINSNDDFSPRMNIELDYIKKIYLGGRISESNKLLIETLAKDRGILVQPMKINYSNLKVEVDL